jgi:hypothetical protein
MVTDVRRVVDNLRGFHALKGKVILSVGAGGGQFLDAYCDARRILAIDGDATSSPKAQRLSRQTWTASIFCFRGFHRPAWVCQLCTVSRLT